ncbi:MAG: hypothetical protein U0R68_18490 [Candidatus Nanopelagicales bacterium]
MSTRTKGILTLALVAGAAVGGYYLWKIAMEKKKVADETVLTIQTELDGLDPATRAAVIAKLSSDEMKRYKAGGATA